ncbi:Na+/H+ antiporter NhaC family protein [Ferroacidibacillus organovorans]|nr:Na+/H+ antiporter NhaC family protein [Ferroacidibacillus organovorans]
MIHPGWLSLLPFAVVIPVSMITRQVIPGLVAGLLTGAFLQTKSLFHAFDQALSDLYQEMQVTGNLHLVVFLYLFGVLVGLIRITGGVHGIAAWLEPRIRTARSAYAITWLSSLATFMAPDFRIITVAPIMKEVGRRLGIKPYDLAYAIDVTSTPLISLVPIGTAFVGYMVGLLAVSLKHAGVATNAYPFFLASLPFNFFAVIILIAGALRSFQTRHSARAVLSDEGDTRSASPVVSGIPDAVTTISAEDPQEPLDVWSERATPSALHLVIPIALLLFLTIGLTYLNGSAPQRSVLQAFLHADAAKAMITAIFITVLLSLVFYLFRKQEIGRLMVGAMSGGNEMMPVIVLLLLVWAVSYVSTQLGFSLYITKVVGHLIPKMLIAPSIFILGSILSYFIGSSFGTWGIMMPLGFTLGIAMHASLPLIAGAVFAGGTLGGFASPLSDNTVAMATVMKLPVMKLARSLLRSTAIAGAISAVLYGVAGMFA